MKTKTLTKKLTLNKETITNLGKEDLSHIQGGISTIPCVEFSITWYCPTELPDCNTERTCPVDCLA